MGSHPHPQIGEPAPSVAVQSLSGGPFPLATLWDKGPVALFFLRHQGCVFCREHAVTLREEYATFQRAGVEVAILLMSSPERVAAIQEELKLPYPCLADPTQAAYRAYEVPRGGWSQVAGFRVWGAGLRAMWKGGIGWPQGDLNQLPAAFVVDREGIVRFAHRATHSADLPDHEAMIAAAQPSTIPIA